MYKTYKTWKHWFLYMLNALMFLALIASAYIFWDHPNDRNKRVALKSQQKVVFALAEIPETGVLEFKFLEEKSKPEVMTSDQQHPTESDISTKSNRDASSDAANIVTSYDMHKPMIGVLILDLGLNESSTANISYIHKPISYGLSPYGTSLDYLVDLAKRYHHELYLHVPLHPDNYPVDNAGVMALLSHLNQETLKGRIDWLLTRAEGIQGVYSSGDEQFTTQQEPLTFLIEALRAHGLSWVHINHHKKSLLYQGESTHHIPMMQADVIVNEALTPEKLEAELHRVKEIALEKGHALVMMKPFPLSISILDEQMKKWEESQIQLVPVSVLHQKSVLKEKS